MSGNPPGSAAQRFVQIGHFHRNAGSVAAFFQHAYFSLLVIFLLQTFSASPELSVVAKGVTLPQSITSREIKDAPVLAISSAGIYLDQKFVGLTEDLLDQPEPLMTRLGELRDLWQSSHPTEKFPGEINLQADQGVSSAVVSRIMGMLPGQSYGSIQLAVIGGGGKG